jgi:hypothetical protein
MEGGKKMTIIKIKNPKIRWLAGFGIMAGIIIIGVPTAGAIFYLTGYYIARVPFTFYPFCMFRDFVDMGWLGTIFAGVYSLVHMGVVAIIIACLIAGAKALGNKFFDP